MQLERQSTTIKKGELDGKPVFTGGKVVKYIALPVDPSGKVSLSSRLITFKGCFGGDPFFNLLDYSGEVLMISTRVNPSVPHIDNYQDAAPILLPIKNPDLFSGIQVIIPILDRAETEDKELILYLG
jgi:hypothetical protein